VQQSNDRVSTEANLPLTLFQKDESENIFSSDSFYYCGSKFSRFAQILQKSEILGFGYSLRQDAKVRKFLASYFAPSRLCGKYSDSFWLRLCRVGSFVAGQSLV
jgi:hypothetical protein